MTRPPTALLASVPRPQSNRIRTRAVAQQGVAALAALSLGACATMFAPGPDTILIQTDPPGAEVLLDGLTVGQTPTNIAVSRRARGNLSLRHPDHPPVDTHLTTTLNGPVLINVLFPGLLGILIDAAGGNCTRWVSPGAIRLPPAVSSAAVTTPIITPLPTQPADSRQPAPIAISEPVASTQAKPTAEPAEPNTKEQAPVTESGPYVGFFVTATGFGLWPASHSAAADAPLEEVMPASKGLPSVRKAVGKTSFLTLATGVPASPTSIYFLDRSGALAVGSILADDEAKGTVRIATEQGLPLPGAAIVDRRGNVVGAASASISSGTEGQREFEAVSCLSIQRILRACPTVTRPMPAASNQDRSLLQLESMLEAASLVTEVEK